VIRVGTPGGEQAATKVVQSFRNGRAKRYRKKRMNGNPFTYRERYKGGVLIISDDAIIRRLHDKDRPTQQQVATEFNVSRGKVAHAVRRNGKHKRRPETPILLLSDLHSGKTTETFNIDVLGQRMETLKEGVLSILNILALSYNFEKIVIPLLGDLIDGDAIYKTHAHHTDRIAPAGRQQVKALACILLPVIADIQRETGLDIEIDGVRGNHGRVTKFTHESNNFDLMFYDLLQAEFRNNKNIDVNISEGFCDIIDVQGHGLLLYHGAGIRMFQSIPWYGITQRVMRWKQSMKRDFIATLLGHFHTCGNMRWIGTDIFMNGTPVTDDDFAMENLGMDGDNRFWLFGCHPERGITWRFPIDLT